MAVLPRMRGALARRIVDAAARGNRLACWLRDREMRAVVDRLPSQSPIVRGDFLTPDPARPLPEDRQGGLHGDFELVPLDRRPVTAADLDGEVVANVMTSLGHYGMGSCGFFGLDLGPVWFIVPIHLAATWIALDGRILENSDPSSDAGWIRGGDDSPLLARLVGARVTAAHLDRHALAITFDNGARLAIDPDPNRRPILARNQRLRAFLPEDDLSAEVFLSPTPEIVV